MAASEIDEGDLIDLNNGVNEYSSINIINSISRGCNSDRSSSPLTNYEEQEQEHLLDVCPPKLEEKLSLNLEDIDKQRDLIIGDKNEGGIIIKIGDNIDNNNHTKSGENTNANLNSNLNSDHADTEEDVSDVLLVTLGHDKVMPIGKRIDVVSSDTIKRVKDITKNLEIVIDKEISCIKNKNDDNYYCGDDIDGVEVSNSMCNGAAVNIVDGQEFGNNFSNETFETQEINDAFNFLTEIDYHYYEDEDENENENENEDEDEDEEDLDGINGSISSDGPLMQEKYSPIIFGSENRGKDKFSEDENNSEIILAGSSSSSSCLSLGSKIVPKNIQNKISRPLSIDYKMFNGAAVSSSSISSNRNHNPKLLFFKSQSLRGPIKNSRKSSCDLYKNDENLFYEDECCNDYDDDDDDDEVKRIIFANGRLRRSLQIIKSDRKSLNEDVVRAHGFYRPNIKFDKYNCLDNDYIEKPSTSNDNRISQRSDFSVRTELEDDDSTERLSSSSSASDVDWSWVEEVESSRAKAVIIQEQIQLQQRSSSVGIHEEKIQAEEEEEEVVVEETEEGAAPVLASTSTSTSYTLTSASASASAEEEEEEEDIPSTSSVNNSNITKRMRQLYNTSSNSTDSIVMSAGGVSAVKSLPVPGCPVVTPHRISTLNQIPQNNIIPNGNNINSTSWVRASMRRLRHLRLPEADQLVERELNPNVSGPGPGPGSSSNNNYQQNNIDVIITARNSLPDIALIAPEILAAQTNGNSLNNININGNGNENGNSRISQGIHSLRPNSAPTTTNRVFGANAVATSPGRGRLTGGRSRGRNQESSRRSSVQSRTTASDTTSCSTSSGNSTATSPASSPSATPQHAAVAAGRRVCERQRGAEREDERGEDDDEDENPLGRWPHALSPALACLGCTLGLFNISRFAILSIQFGANFIVQFLVLSLVLGIPIFTLQVCLGQRLAAGAVDMWRISPLFQGVGIALLTAQAFIGIYSIVGISWMFVYFRDSFITKQDKYRWAEPFLLYRDDTKPMNNGTSYKLQETVPDYFSGAVLQRHHLNEPEAGIVTLKFQVAFNLAVVWMIVFVSLSKGLRSYGKVVYVFTLLPVFGTLVLCAKLLGLTPTGSIHQLFPATVWSEFFINGKSWMAASTEVFLTWGLFGAAAMQIAAHNKHKHLLQRDTSLVVVLTFVVLLLSAFLANTCVQILRHHGYIYTTSSFESISGYTFMHLFNQPIHPGQISSPERFMNHASFLAGQRVVRHGANLSTESGYQVLRLATELVPATLAVLGSEQVSPFWAVLFYFILILFGIAQQLAIWHCVITGIMAINTKMMKLWETTITFFSCACGYILGLPMATEFGIYVVYYLDYTVGGAWWIIVLYLVQVGAVFAVRGRPHTGEAVVAELFPPTGRCLRHWAGPLLSFTWNVVLPVALMVLSIMIFKSSGFQDLYTYRKTGREYWSVWARQLGAAIQLIPILMIPVVAVIQTCRYLNSGPPDIFDVRVRRIQLLYRPSLEPDDAADPQTQAGNDTTTSLHGNGILPSTTDVPFEDPPPKYTPPPSYTTATGARIAKMLRQSFRRSVRRIANVLGEGSTPRPRPALQPPPPDYATVLVEMNQGIPSRDISIIVTEAGPDVTDVVDGRRNSFDRRRPNTIDRTMRISTIDRTATERSHSTMDRGRRTHTNNGSSNLTAADVANLLRSSIRRGTSRNQQSLSRNFASNEPTAAVSIENLVEAAAPIGQDSLVLTKDESLVFEEDESDDKKTVDQTENNATTVI